MSLATQVASLPHPPSAMKFNGVYLEDKISGYYTESVEGRYNSSIEITDRSISGADGSEFIRKRYETRSLDVKYSIYADTKIELHTKESQVKQYTREAEAKIIFDDEPQYYWIGTVSEIKSEGIDATGSGIFVSTGTITISLNDPYKYSTVTKAFKAVPNKDGYMEMIIKNEGTAPVPIDYTITHGSGNDADNGYIGIVSPEGIIQIGNIQEVDKKLVRVDENVIVLPWKKIINGNIYKKDDSQGVSVEVMKPGLKGYGLAISKNGGIRGWWTSEMLSGRIPPDERWHYGYTEFALDGDNDGNVGATNFYAFFRRRFSLWRDYDYVSQEISFLTNDNREICSTRIYKNGYSTYALADYIVNGTTIMTTQFMPRFFGHGSRTCFAEADDYTYDPSIGVSDCRKEGSFVSFHGVNGHYSTYIDPAIKDLVCTKVRFTFGMYADTRKYSGRATRMNEIVDFYLSQDRFNIWSDVPNRFKPGCVVTVDGNKSQIYVDGLRKASEEVIGSKYFLAPPGETKVEFHFSPFCTTLPTCTASIREKYL